MHIDWIPEEFKEKDCEWKGGFKLKKLKYAQQRELAKKYSLDYEGDLDQEGALNIIDKLVEFCYQVVESVDVQSKKGKEKFTSFEDMVDDGRFSELYQELYHRILRGFFVGKKSISK